MKSNSAYARRRPTENDFKFIEQRVRLNGNADRPKANGNCRGNNLAGKKESSLFTVNSASLGSRNESDELSNRYVMVNARSRSNSIAMPFQINR